MDYTTQPYLFKIKKVFRYIKIFGVSRTFIKITSQLHMKKGDGFNTDSWINPEGRDQGDVAIVGCGNFAFSTIGYYLNKHKKGSVKYALDIDKAKSKSLVKKYRCYAATTDFDTILNDADTRLVYIASNHASHAEYAIKAIEAGKHVHIEKPHAVSEEQLDRLLIAMKMFPDSRVFLGFNRPQSTLFKQLKEKLDVQPGNTMINWFIAGHEIEDDHWYFSEEEGGRILGNLCHWSDLCIHLIGMENCFPCVISPAIAKENKSNFAVTMTFHDGSQAGITFSAKGHTFEGVREYLNIHKGDLLGSLQDFYVLRMDINDKKSKRTLWFRDHGHRENIINSYVKSLDVSSSGEQIEYIKGSGLLVLKIKEAVESGSPVTCAI
jgi:predicted dehydrogenase